MSNIQMSRQGVDTTRFSGYDYPMDINEMTDEALHALSLEIEAKHAPRPHTFGGIDGRCFDCDVRPSSRYAHEPCI